MSSYKADQRYINTDNLHESQSDDTLMEDEEDVPYEMLRVRHRWQLQYQDDIELLYSNFLETGRAIFGSAFHQLGRLDNFANFAFKYMQPGAF